MPLKPSNLLTMKTMPFFAILLLLLSACQSPAPISTPTEDARSAADQIQQLLNEAKTASAPLRQEKQLAAIRLLLQQQQTDLAQQILDDIDSQQLPPSLFVEHSELSARVQLQREQYQQGLDLLNTPQLLQLLQQTSQLSPQQQTQLSLLQAQLLALKGDHLASAQQRIFIDSELRGEQQAANREALWFSLTQASIDALQQTANQTFSEEYRGWLQLALIAKDNQGDLDRQLERLQDWRNQYIDHPAANPLPGGLALLQQLAAERPRQLALILPFSGNLAPFGKAVRDGFLAALYQTRERGGQVPAVRFYDSQQTTDINALVQQAVDEGAELIIGPLDKQVLQQLFQRDSMPVSTLALNRLAEGMPPLGLFQFGLSPDDEASQIAELAYSDNRQRAMIIAPQGEWGDRVSSTFSQRWQALGGEIVALSRFDDQQDMSNDIKNALLLQESEQRARQLQSLLGTRLEFEPRRRQDVDMVFLLARPQQARSIKPLLAFHYAADIPVYATSRIYSGYPQPQKDRDLNGIRFVDLPWLLQPADSLQQQISRELDQSHIYQRMYALGIDCFQLYPRLRQLELITNSRVYGKTGDLQLNERNEIVRHMPAAQFKRGKPVLIPGISQSLMDGVASNDQDGNKTR